MDTMSTDVLIVGAGPTGLMAANQLARRGVRTQIVDRNAGPSLQSKALGLHARTLEIYAQLGIAARALKLGKRATGAQLWARGQRAARVPLGDIGRDLSPYPFLLILGQDDNERLLGEALRDQGMTVAWNTELVGLSQEPGHVTVRLKQPDGTTRDLTTAWVLGCDGARSAVRELSGITFGGAPYQHVFFIADVEVSGPMAPEELNVYLWRDGFHLFFPMRGINHWRVVGIVPEALRGKDDLTLEDVIPSIREEAGPDLSFQRCSWFSTYRIHHRRAERFRDRRCFLLGDAAHIHSPVGAQGMNTGLQDAYNLAWKLALVVSDRAHPALLASYEEERIPVAQRLLSTTDRAFTFLVSDGRLAGSLRTRLFPKILARAMSIERARKLAFRTISQTGIRYRRSFLSKLLDDLPEAAPRPGDRFPWLRLKLRPDGPTEDLFERLDDTHFNLIVVGQSLPPGAVPMLDGLVRLHDIPNDPANHPEFLRAHIPTPSFYLLRPDGHVGLAGIRLRSAELADYLAERVHLVPPGGRVSTPNQGAMGALRSGLDA